MKECSVECPEGRLFVQLMDMLQSLPGHPGGGNLGFRDGHFVQPRGSIKPWVQTFAPVLARPLDVSLFRTSWPILGLLHRLRLAAWKYTSDARQASLQLVP